MSNSIELLLKHSERKALTVLKTHHDLKVPKEQQIV